MGRRSTTSKNTSAAVDTQDAPFWPTEVASLYSSVRLLGRGKFGFVWEAAPNQSSSRSNQEADIDDFVAIKFLDMSTEGNRTSALREATILSQLPAHPCVCSLILSLPVPSAEAQALVLRISRGPTLQELITKRGALGLPLAKIVARDLIRAVGFLHGRGVLHRDIKPDNCVIEGADIEKDWCWMDQYDDVDAPPKEKPVRLVLIDFGFARALSPLEVGDDVGLSKLTGELRKEATAERNHQATACALREPQVPSEINAPLDEDIRTEHGANDYISAGKPCKGSNTSMIGESFVNRQSSSGRNSGRSSWRGLFPSGQRNSISHNEILDLSAVGSRAFAAPELMRGVKKNKSAVGYFGTAGLGKASGALTKYVSSYGMVADAYSIGAIVREVYTGVPPRRAIDEYISKKRTPLVRVAFAYRSMRARKKGQRKPILFPNMRKTVKLPQEVILLVDALTCPDHRSRMTVRAALGTPWLMDEKCEADGKPGKMKRRGSMSGKEIEYLPCALDSLILSNDGAKKV
eukprot:CAMPEP_0194268244 /NCGR_PEP_ID=MMETSP0169-20130528/2605_1 /TAXON_ID=218684 /ORGANISM="Corethron pennatum, Strain L29A3" /LENGTH=519 /DNA_ID=CAMNT_0039009407 /DNA_START=31 /DNA_END=1590 /DNA_ORIENTATION=-